MRVRFRIGLAGSLRRESDLPQRLRANHQNTEQVLAGSVPILLSTEKKIRPMIHTERTYTEGRLSGSYRNLTRPYRLSTPVSIITARQ